MYCCCAVHSFAYSRAAFDAPLQLRPRGLHRQRLPPPNTPLMYFWSGGLVRTEVMAVLPSVPACLCAVLSLLACSPALLKAWKRPSPEVLALGVVSTKMRSFN